METSKKGKRKNKRKKSGKKNTRGSGFFFALLITLMVFFVSSFFYYKYHHEIHEMITEIGQQRHEITVNLYFADPKSRSLVQEERRIDAGRHTTSQAEQVILELLKGPKTSLTKTIPHGTSLLHLSIDTDHLAHVDFSSELTQKHTGGSSAELLTIYSIVNSLTLNFEEIEKGQILVEGEKVDTIAGHIFARTPFKSNRKIVGN